MDDSMKDESAEANEIYSLVKDYSTSMLRGFGCLPIERIHALLKMYANPDISIETVKAMLEIKMKEQLVKYTGGLYRLNK